MAKQVKKTPTNSKSGSYTITVRHTPTEDKTRPTPKGTQKAIDQLRGIGGTRSAVVTRDTYKSSDNNSELTRDDFYDVLKKISRPLVKSD